MFLKKIEIPECKVGGGREGSRLFARGPQRESEKASCVRSEGWPKHGDKEGNDAMVPTKTSAPARAELTRDSSKTVSVTCLRGEFSSEVNIPEGQDKSQIMQQKRKKTPTRGRMTEKGNERAGDGYRGWSRSGQGACQPQRRQHGDKTPGNIQHQLQAADRRRCQAESHRLNFREKENMAGGGGGETWF